MKRKCCFIWAKSISTFLRKRREFLEGFGVLQGNNVLPNGLFEWHRQGALGPRVHCCRIGHILQSRAVARYICIFSFCAVRCFSILPCGQIKTLRSGSKLKASRGSKPPVCCCRSSTGICGVMLRSDSQARKGPVPYALSAARRWGLIPCFSSTRSSMAFVALISCAIRAGVASTSTMTARAVSIIVGEITEPAAPFPGRMRKKAFRSLLSLSVVSPRGGELNTSGAESGASLRVREVRIKTLVEPKAERAYESARCESKRKEASFIAECGKTLHRQIGFSAPC